MIRFSTLIIVLSLFCVQQSWAERPTLRIGVLKFGTVNWELQTIKNYRLDEQAGFKLEVVPFAGKQATTTALHGKGVDVIVNDWIWVSRQRYDGRPYSFIPYSRMVGGFVTKPDIKNLSDLKGKKIGIAGGPVDKSWLLFQAYAQKHHGFDLAGENELVFGAPPLLSKKLETGELDGVVNFWHYIAKLEAKGFTRLLDVSDLIQDFGLHKDVPMIGYVFIPEIDPVMITALSNASRQAKEILRNQPQAWEKLTPFIKAKTAAEFKALKEGFLNGIPEKWDEETKEGAAQLYSVLARLGGEKLVGKGKVLESGTFAAVRSDD